jgi:hypothetical protein
VATRADFTDEQWDTLVFAIEDTVMLVSVANGPKFFESVAEIGATARFMAEQRKMSRSTLVRDLTDGIGLRRDGGLVGDPVHVESAVLSRVAEAFAIVTDTAPDEAAAFKEFLLEIAQTAAEARHGVNDQEANAIEKIKSALL